MGRLIREYVLYPWGSAYKRVHSALVWMNCYRKHCFRYFDIAHRRIEMIAYKILLMAASRLEQH